MCLRGEEDWLAEGASCVVFPFLRGFRLDIEDDDAGALEDSSEERDDGPGWDIAGRFRGPRRGGAAVGAAVWGAGAAVRCLLALRGGEEGVVCSGSSRDRSRRTGALRFRDGAGPAAGIEDEGPELGESAASLAAERVTLREGEAAVAEDAADGGEGKAPVAAAVEKSSRGSWWSTAAVRLAISLSRESSMGVLARRRCQPAIRSV